MPQTLTTLGNLFDNQKLRVRIDQISRLDDPVGSNPLSGLPRLDRSVSGAQIHVIDQLFEAGGSLKADVELLGVGVKVDPFGTGAKAPLSSDKNLGLLSVAVSSNLKTEAGGGSGETRISARAGASGELLYRHYLPLDPKRKLGNALGSLVRDTRLPNLVDLEKPPARGEVHSLDAKLRLDFAISGQAGYKVSEDLLTTVSQNLSQPFKFNAEASLRAALGLSLYDRISFVVGRAHQHRDGWVRVRVQRENERRLSFTAAFALDLEYDFGTGLAQLFEEMIEQVPVPRLVRTAETITSTLETGDWDAAKKRLTAEMEEVLDDLVSEVLELATGQDQDWRDWLDGDPRIAQIVDFAREVVEFYDSLDARVASLWERLVSKAKLEEGSTMRSWLEELAEIGDQGLSPDDFLGGNAATLAQAVEAISGRSLEEIVLDNAPTFKETLADVSTVASDTLDLITGTPGQVLEQIKKFTEKTGIGRTVDELRKLDSKDDLKTAASNRIRNLAGRLVDKAWDRLTKADLEAVRSWAETVHDWLPDPTAPGTKAAELASRIKTELEKIKLDYGLSIGIEIERVSRTTALLDFEIDYRQASSQLRRDVSQALRTGRLQRVVEILADASHTTESLGTPIDQGDEPSSAPYRLRECVFTSERIRSEAQNVSFSLVGLGINFKTKERAFNRRIEQSTLRVEQPQVAGGGQPVRTATYAAAYQRGDQTGPHDNEGGVWLVSSLKSTDVRPEADFETETDRFLRLTFAWESEHIQENEISGLSRLFSDLGFQPASPDVTLLRTLLVPGEHVRSSFEIRFHRAALDRFFGGSWNGDVAAEGRWNRAFLNAAYRWLSEGYVQRGHISNSPWSLGHTLARIVTSDPFRKNWLSVGGFFDALGGKTFHLPDPGHSEVQIKIGRPDGDPTDLTGPTKSILEKRGKGWKALAKLRKAYSEAISSRSPAAYRELSETFANTWKQASLQTLRWPSSLGAIWLWIAAVAALDPELLKDARGVARVHRRSALDGAPASNASGTEAQLWNPPEYWTLPIGIPIPQPGMFPIHGEL